MKNKVILQTVLAVLQTLTGAGLVLFFAGHFFGISTIKFGGGWFDYYASHLDHSNLLIEILIWLVVLAVFLHGINGLRVVLHYFRKAGSLPGFLIDTKYRDSFLWYAHFSAGILIGITVISHLIIDCFTAEAVTTAEMVKDRLQNDWYFASMALLLVSVIFHGCCGVRNIFVKYGFLTKHHQKIKIALLIIGVILTILGMHNLFLFRWGG